MIECLVSSCDLPVNELTVLLEADIVLQVIYLVGVVGVCTRITKQLGWSLPKNQQTVKQKKNIWMGIIPKQVLNQIL